MVARDQGEEAMVIEFDVDNLNAFVAGGAMYTKDKLLGPSDSKEVNFRKLSKDERANMQEAMAQEVSEVLRSQALRAAREKFDEQTMRDRIIPMRWLLTWKPLSEPADQPVGSQPPLPGGGSGRRYRLQDR